jgi:putative SOS response-associated peptidase YedK
MCGRYSNNIKLDMLMREFGAEPGTAYDWLGRFSIAPTVRAPIIRAWTSQETLTRSVDLARWGLAPAWAKEGTPRPINARIETVTSSGMFRSAFASQRCIVPMNGYYEWKTIPSGKQPHFIHGPGILAAAGLYAGRKDAVTGEWDHSFTIITRQAQDASGEIHDRMPAFLLPDLWDEWLRPDKLTDTEAMVAELTTSSAAVAATIETYPVSRQVNSVQKADPMDATLIAPITA